MPVLERENELSALAAVGAGSVVLIGGEAGIGKSTLIAALPTVLPAGMRLLVGYCDDLATPRVLGPFRDLIGTGLTEALESGDRIFDALRAELMQPTVLVVEDVHWADEATLDVLRFLIRRIASLPSALVLTYRDADDEPLRQLLGLASNAERLRPARLSPDAVRLLGAHTSMDPEQVYEVTSGNPFFVTEVLASGDAARVPRSVAEAVRGRLSEPATRAVVEQLAVIPSAAELWLVEAVVPGGVAALADAERRGVLTVSPTTVAFGHELARRAILDSLPATRRIACNQAVLAALLERPGVDVSRIVHHAAEAGADDVIIRYGPIAARAAAATGAHREAVAHYRLVVDRLDAFDPDLAEAYAIECSITGLYEQAVRVQEEVVQRRRDHDDVRALGLSVRWLSRMYWWVGDRIKADACGAEAVAILEQTGEEQALVLALNNQAQLSSLAGRYFDAEPLARRAAAMAEAVGDAGQLSHALNTLGQSVWWDEGRTHLEESLRVALAGGGTEAACRAYVNLSMLLVDVVDLDEAERILTAGIALADEAEFLGYLRFLRLNLSQVDFMRDRWDRVEREAGSFVDAELALRCNALLYLGRIRVRRGQEGGEALLRQAWTLAQQLTEPQAVCPAAAALLELAWLQEDLPRAASELVDVYRGLAGLGRPPGLEEFESWMRDAGVQIPDESYSSPHSLFYTGAWREAADAWARAGCRYESALAVARGADSPDDLLAALRTADELGATPLAGRIRARLRELGVARVPRGPQPATRGNPAGLTSRQADVVRLLAEGLTNAEIAARLVLSVRTVDTHVAAALDKLGVRTRRAAVSRARALGLD
ncbi:AAA family ATPase [Cryptosporangium sp. NPDC048952]|uniref:ATP-binding protein n=1 Tax=Cryptosporangium sp. NPDC048952 TaxID=3363961 RepID=UPI0037114DF6